MNGTHIIVYTTIPHSLGPETFAIDADDSVALYLIYFCVVLIYHGNVEHQSLIVVRKAFPRESAGFVAKCQV